VTELRTVAAFLTKFLNDWGLNLAGLLAYNFLTALFPLLLGILAIGAFFLPDQQIHQLADRLSAALPGEVTSDSGLKLNFYQMLVNFRHTSRLTATISFIGFLWTGSNLFGVMENCFSIIFRTRGRNPIHQKLMAVGMIFFFAILTPLAVGAATVSGSLAGIAGALGAIPGLGVLLSVGGYLIGVAAAFLLFFLIYVIVPNWRYRPGQVWRGALVAAVLFEVANSVFPYYVGHFMRHAWYGRVLLLVGILVLWFWVIALIVILGAEINSFVALRQAPLDADLAGLVHVLARQRPAATRTRRAPGPGAVGQARAATFRRKRGPLPPSPQRQRFT
jgi:membrane protein